MINKKLAWGKTARITVDSTNLDGPIIAVCADGNMVVTVNEDGFSCDAHWVAQSASPSTITIGATSGGSPLSLDVVFDQNVAIVLSVAIAII